MSSCATERSFWLPAECDSCWGRLEDGPKSIGDASGGSRNGAGLNMRGLLTSFSSDLYWRDPPSIGSATDHPFATQSARHVKLGHRSWRISCLRPRRRISVPTIR